MSRLTLILESGGLLNEEARRRVETFVREHGCSHLEAVLRLQLADEQGLTAFLASNLLIPRVAPELLRRVDETTLAQVPADLAWMHEVLPISLDDLGNLTLAMADPTRMPAVEAIAVQTGAYLIRAVAPLTPLRAALHQHYGPPPPLAHGPLNPRTQPTTHDEPLLAPPLSPAAFQQTIPKLHLALDRDAIIECMLDFLAEGFGRVILFIHLRDQLRGRDARGGDLLLDAVTRVRIPTNGPSHFATAIKSGVPYVGPWSTQESIDVAFSRAMGGIEGHALVLPIHLREKIPLLVFACGASHPFALPTMQELAATVSLALERFIFRLKRSGAYPTVG